MFTFVLHTLSAFAYKVWIIEMEAKQYGTNILVFTMGRQA
jgi:hypothetical protein